ncbi:MAG: hypothetical protein QOE69_2868, partial [Thermoleophilaceae bacterium]|nr:hypothetical protein [Thermoleophilaceae bacterium]
MLNVRSRIGMVAVGTSAAVLLAVPVVAAGQVPVVQEVVGGVTQTAESLAPAPAPVPALPAPAAKAPAPQTPAPKPAPQPASSAPAAAPAA